MFSSLKDIVPKTLTKRGLAHSFSAAYICEKTRKILEDMFGSAITEKLTRCFVKQGKLFIEVGSSVWSHEVLTNRQRILKSLREQENITSIEKIIVLVKYPERV